MKYRPEIDGLRAVAVLPVIFFHAGFKGFAGGFIGVDVFFVISGYLITALLIAALSDARASKPFNEIMLDFYERRARRILPALFVVLFATTILAFSWVSAGSFKDFAKSLIAVSLFGSNFLFWREQNYFAGPAEETPLLHTWSLAVEEQFYILFPLLFILIWRFGRPRAVLALGALALISLAVSEWSSHYAPSANFFLPHTRAFELLAGSLTAVYLAERQPKPNQILSLAGLCLILSAVILYNSDTPFPGLTALIPVGGAVLIILYCTPGTFAFQLLASRFLVTIGLISYSAYLWHQPLFALVRIRSIDTPSMQVMLALTALSLILAWVTWAYVERPFRVRHGHVLISQRNVFVGSFAAGASFIAFGVFALLPGAFADHFRGPTIGKYIANNYYLHKRSWDPLKKLAGKSKKSTYQNTGEPFENTVWFKDRSKPHLLLIGNSHSKDLYNTLIDSNDAMTHFDVARFGLQLDNVPKNFFDAPNYRDSNVVIIATRYPRQSYIDAVPDLVRKFRSDGKRVIIVPNTPEFTGTLNGNLADKLLYRADTFAPGQAKLLIRKVNEKYYQDLDPTGRVTELNTKLVAVAHNLGVPILDRHDLECDDNQEICYGLGPNFEKHFFDYGHLTLEGAAFFGKRIDDLDWLELRRADGPFNGLGKQSVSATNSSLAKPQTVLPIPGSAGH